MNYVRPTRQELGLDDDAAGWPPRRMVIAAGIPVALIAALSFWFGWTLAQHH